MMYTLCTLKHPITLKAVSNSSRSVQWRSGVFVGSSNTYINAVHAAPLKIMCNGLYYIKLTHHCSDLNFGANCTAPGVKYNAVREYMYM